MTNKKLVFSTAGSKEEAQKIARILVERLLAACVNIIAVGSIYRWEGEVEQAQEWLLVIKTTDEGFDRVRAAITELHSYEVPECISVAVEDGSAEYLQWISESVK
ncbi:MAG TPA: divalent-cation tolerance protein CutA [Pyrinomonadaceae bacterium]|jgi:periplasmic divalent cation tolerance protein|nr:divalent-cation tolerance protein CutA [Pyrinomonadaceae bacterium]